MPKTFVQFSMILIREWIQEHTYLLPTHIPLSLDILSTPNISSNLTFIREFLPCAWHLVKASYIITKPKHVSLLLLMKFRLYCLMISDIVINIWIRVEDVRNNVFVKSKLYQFIRFIYHYDVKIYLTIICHYVTGILSTRGRPSMFGSSCRGFGCIFQWPGTGP